MALIDVAVAGVDGRPDDLVRSRIGSDEGDFRHGAYGRRRDSGGILRTAVADGVFLLQDISQRHCSRCSLRGETVWSGYSAHAIRGTEWVGSQNASRGKMQ